MTFKENFKRELSRLRPTRQRLKSVEDKLDKTLKASFAAAMGADAIATVIGHMGSDSITEGAPRVKGWMNNYGFGTGLALGVGANLAFIGGTYAAYKLVDRYMKKQDTDSLIPSKTPLYVTLGIATVKHLEGATSWF